MKASKVVMTFLPTANGLYIRHEADRVEQSYSVEGDPIWENINPALFGIATPFKSLKEVEAAKNAANTRLSEGSSEKSGKKKSEGGSSGSGE